VVIDGLKDVDLAAARPTSILAIAIFVLSAARIKSNVLIIYVFQTILLSKPAGA